MRTGIPFVSLFWLPALAFSKWGSFFPDLLVDTPWMGWPGEALLARGGSILAVSRVWPWVMLWAFLGDAGKVGADRLPMWFRFQEPLSPLTLC